MDRSSKSLVNQRNTAAAAADMNEMSVEEVKQEHQPKKSEVAGSSKASGENVTNSGTLADEGMEVDQRHSVQDDDFLDLGEEEDYGGEGGNLDHEDLITHPLETKILEFVTDPDLASAVSKYFKTQLRYKINVVSDKVDKAYSAVFDYNKRPVELKRRYSPHAWKAASPGFDKEMNATSLDSIFDYDEDFQGDDDIEDLIQDLMDDLRGLCMDIEVKVVGEAINLMTEPVPVLVELKSENKCAMKKIKCSFTEVDSKLERYLEVVARVCDWVHSRFA